MSTNRTGANQRRSSILESLETQPRGGVTTHAAKLMAAPLGGTEETCTVTGYYRTSVFEFPGCHLISKGPIRPQLITESPGLKAVIVSNLPAYFQKGNPKPRHYAIDTSLRAGIECAYRKQTGPHTSRRMFVVIEQDARVQPTTFENGECFMIDEHREGRAIIEGGREGKRALLAVRTVDGAWPSFSPDIQGRNSVLAALKIEQNVAHPIVEFYSCSCFVSDDDRPIYTLHPTMGIRYGGVRVTSPVDQHALEAKVTRIRSIHAGLRKDSEALPQVAELVDSVLVDDTKDEGHFRLWYLRLWQAVMDAKKYLREPRLEEGETAIAGTLTPRQLKEYRHRVAHWWTGQVDFSFVTDIQYTVLELMRRKYGKQD